KTGENRVNRGGSWNNSARNCRSANRNRNNPGNRNNNLGFRVVLIAHRSSRSASAEPDSIPPWPQGEQSRLPGAGTAAAAAGTSWGAVFFTLDEMTRTE
ncbi:MAG: SUMF1/EgtB/PvdO family nonheme iron enzyme, partial [Planctomycetota bacterium]|nr:SUMF1/EgtB/PvdO family nonheme iron enzyme [Planctomycetota bacterium]